MIDKEEFEKMKKEVMESLEVKALINKVDGEDDDNDDEGFGQAVLELTKESKKDDGLGL